MQDSAPLPKSKRRPKASPSQGGYRGFVGTRQNAVRRRREPTNPLGVPLLALFASSVLGAVYFVFGIGEYWFHLALGAAVLYGGSFIITMSIAGVYFGTVWIVRKLTGEGTKRKP